MTTIITTTKIATMMRITIIPAAIAPILVDPPEVYREYNVKVNVVDIVDDIS